MTPSLVGWLISVILWAIFAIFFFVSSHRNDYEMMTVFNILQLIAIIFVWVFLGFYRNWW